MVGGNYVGQPMSWTWKARHNRDMELTRTYAESRGIWREINRNQQSKERR